MSESKPLKMISVSKITTGIFKGCTNEFIRVCPGCGENIYHTYNDDHSIDFFTLCDCKAQEQLDEALEREKNKLELYISRNKERCGFGKRDIEEVSKKYETHKGNIQAFNTVLTYGNKFTDDTSTGLYLYGPTGVGKSLLAKKALTIVLNKGYSAYITNVPKLMNDIKKENQVFSKDTLNKCIDVDLLVLDDFGAERGTEYETEQLFLILESRWRDYKPIIFTSNCDLDEISQKYNDKNRLFSRISGTSVILRVDGEDMRTKETISL